MPTAIIRSSMIISDDNANPIYRSFPEAFETTLANEFGPTPGAILVPVAGVDVDLSAMTNEPGWCKLHNKDDTNFVTYGIYDATYSGVFYPFGELGPGDCIVVKLSRFLGDIQDAVGTGTAAVLPCTWHFKADTDPCEVVVEAFER